MYGLSVKKHVNGNIHTQPLSEHGVRKSGSRRTTKGRTEKHVKDPFARLRMVKQTAV
jgi:hypothetical protein